MSDNAVDFSEGEEVTTIDWNDVEDSSFEVMPKGMYPCLVSECEFTYSQRSGNPMWTVTLEVSEGEYAGRKLFTHLVFGGKALPITKETLQRIKPELLEMNPFDYTDEEAISNMLGTAVKAKVGIRKYEGQDRNNVDRLFPGGGDGFV